MDQIRKPFQGVKNIIAFNWHFYALAFLVILFLLILPTYFGGITSALCYTILVLVTFSVVLSLLVSYYIYDFSDLYNLNWLKENIDSETIMNIHAGFDETSILLRSKFPEAELIVLDFYDPHKNTEMSIRRARKKYPPYLGTQKVETDNLEFESNSINRIFLIFSAHEIRQIEEQDYFFRELYRILKPNGFIYVTEHLRDIPNFLAYNLGFYHFYSKMYWLNIFENVHLKVKEEIKINPFVTTFKIQKNGNTP